MALIVSSALVLTARGEGSAIAREVKLADLRDNLNRLADLPEPERRRSVTATASPTSSSPTGTGG